MSTEFVSTHLTEDLTPGQWDALKSLRAASTPGVPVKPWALDELIGLGLAEMRGGLPILTHQGRTTLVRGSTRLLDVAA